MNTVFLHHIFICTQEKPDGIPSCTLEGGPALLEAFRKEIIAANLADKIAVTGCGCLGLCHDGPNVVIYPEGRWLTKVKPEEVPKIVKNLFIDQKSLFEREDPDPESIRAKIFEHREKVKKMKAMQEKAGVLPEELNSMVRSFWKSRPILTAIELDIFTAVRQGATVQEVARRIEASQRGTEILLNALTALGLLIKDNEQYRNSLWANTYLCEGAPHDARLSLMHAVNLWPRWSTMTECVKQGTTQTPHVKKDEPDEKTRSFIGAMHHHAAFSAQFVAKAIILDGVKRVLDLGGGSGAYSVAFAKEKPDLEATVLDLPHVIPLTRRYMDESGVGERLKTVIGNLRKDDYGQDYDLVYISSIAHMNSPEQNIDMLRRAYNALKPGGRVVLRDFMLEDDKTRPIQAALFALNMLVATEAGNSYSWSEYTHWLEETGFEKIGPIRLSGPTDMIAGTKPV